MSIHDGLADACRAVGILPPRTLARGRWLLADVEGKANGKGDGRVMIDADGAGGVAWNHQTGQHARWRATGTTVSRAQRVRDEAKDREALVRQKDAEAAAARIVAACVAEPHPYLERKGFPTERGLGCHDVRACLPRSALGRAMADALPEGDGPMLIVPGRIGRAITTVQFITPAGAKKNLLGGRMGGACHRIASGRGTWVCEGIATALSVRAALQLLGRPATVLSAFSASNVAKIAAGIPGSIIAADHDKTVDALGCGTGEFYARRSGARWVMPPELGDWNDYHAAHGLRAVALLLREVRP